MELIWLPILVMILIPLFIPFFLKTFRGLKIWAIIIFTGLCFVIYEFFKVELTEENDGFGYGLAIGLYSLIFFAAFLSIIFKGLCLYLQRKNDT
ncbi:MAG: hypothetical protein H6861_02465 [Rhodospirillales bacterium]|nr:hypothetical protein [Rhodospirillales bacterium]